MSARIPASAWELTTGLNPGGPYIVASIATDKGWLVSTPINYDEDTEGSSERAIRAAKQACREWMASFGAKWTGKPVR